MVGNRKAVPSATNRRARRAWEREEFVALIEELKALLQKSERFIKDGEALPPSPASSRQTHRSVHALVVDDQHDAAESFSRLLQTLGCAATFVTKPDKAVDAVDSLEAEIIFIRSGVNDIHAFQLARTFRERYGDALMLVAVTDSSAPAHRTEFDAYVVKPVDINVVQSMIDTVLLNRR